MVVIAFGLLGIAGMQALSISNTSVAGFRSIAALQASSIAAAMSANEAYWQPLIGSSSTTTVSNTVITSTDPSLNGSTAVCLSILCSPSAMAGYDLWTWGQTLWSVLPNGTGEVDCVAGPPVTCKILVSWVEKSLVQNQAASASVAAGNPSHFEMMVQP